MTVVRGFHEDYGATFGEAGGRALPLDYGRPDRAHRAVRNVVGVTELAHGVLVVEGEDRHAFVDDVVTNAVPTADGEGCYALLLDPQGGIRADLYVLNAGERLLVFTPPSAVEDLHAEWSEKIFLQDVELAEATDEFALFGVHGPKATEKIASVLNGATAPDERLSFVRGRMSDEGVTVLRDDGLTGEEGYVVTCAAEAADEVLDTLINNGLNAVPFGRRVWEALTLEAGTPLFETELEGVVPNVLGLRNALDFEKGCYVGQEVVSRVENQGRPSQRLVGLVADAVPEPGAAVFEGDASVGDVTRADESEMRGEPIALALVDFDLDPDADLTVRVDGEDVPAEIESLPFVAGSDESARLPRYE